MGEAAVQRHPQAAAKAGANVAEFTVSELSAAIKRTLEGGFSHVRLRGEISGYRGPHASGHCYFALKDDGSKMEAVVWRGVFQNLRFKPEEGMEVFATGRVTTFPGSSKYQLVIEAMEPAGAGALMALLEERKRKLAAEGLFAPERKRRIPFLPKVVGIITSPTGAVIRDMLHGFDERFPTHVVLWPVRVQGPTCAPEVAAAVRGFDALDGLSAVPRPDLLIVARGGGSLEDLWGFNEEEVVRAVANCRIPVISAVGHETDWTLIDLVSDARAPTPTKAAEWAVPKRSDLMLQLDDYGLRLGTSLKRTLERERVRLRAAARGLPRPADLLAMPRQRLDGAAGRLPRALLAACRTHANRFAKVGTRLGPRLVAARLERAGDRLQAAAAAGNKAFRARLDRQEARLKNLSDRLQPRLVLVRTERGTERLGQLEQRRTRALAHMLQQRRRQLAGQSQVLASLSHRSALARGFAIVRDAEGRMLRSRFDVDTGDRLALELADGILDATVGDAPTISEERAVQPSRPAEQPAPPRPQPLVPTRASPRRPWSKPEQGTLF